MVIWVLVQRLEEMSKYFLPDKVFFVIVLIELNNTNVTFELSLNNYGLINSIPLKVF